MISPIQFNEKPAFLASVLSAAEARLALHARVDIIDCKNPSAGALGALNASEVTACVAVVEGRKIVSATIGDLPNDAPAMVKAAERIAATGVDIVKVGFFDSVGLLPVVRALGTAKLGKARLWAVLMADRNVDLSIVHPLASAGFAGVMLDTADKTSGSLLDLCPLGKLAAFLQIAQAARLASGLAGSLTREDVPRLVPLRPDVIGFRGALCAAGRTGDLDAARTVAIARDIAAARRASPAVCPPLTSYQVS